MFYGHLIFLEKQLTSKLKKNSKKSISLLKKNSTNSFLGIMQIEKLQHTSYIDQITKVRI